MYADRRDAGARSQLSPSRNRGDGRAGTHLPLLRSGSKSPGARSRTGPPPRFFTPGPRIGFGAWALGSTGWGTADGERERMATVRRALERGVAFFDTAPTYGDGTSEVLLGRAVKPDRERVAVATKVGPTGDPRASLEASLRRLDTDYVDLVQLHEAQPGWERQLERLHELRDEGKALAVGLCNATHRQLAQALDITPLASYQGPFNLVDRDVEERTLPLCRERALAFLAYRPLASGLLTGKYTQPPAFPEGDHRRKIYWFKGPEFARRRAVMERLEAIARRRGTPLAALALGWVLARPGVSIALAGARSAAQVDENLVAVEHPLTPEEVTAIDETVAQVFHPPRASVGARTLAAGWGVRERYIVEQLDGTKRYETIAAEWTDRGDPPMVAAQVKVIVDQLVEQGLAE